jgi:hypothetical protein
MFAQLDLPHKSLSFPAGTRYSAPSLYLYNSTRVGFNEAKAACEAWGGSLASILSTDEQTLVFNLNATGADPKWIGLVRNRTSQSALPFYWLDGSALVFNNFKSGYPDDAGGNENAVSIGRIPSSSDDWDDNNVSVQLSYVCKRQVSRLNAIL